MRHGASLLVVAVTYSYLLHSLQCGMAPRCSLLQLLTVTYYIALADAAIHDTTLLQLLTVTYNNNDIRKEMH